MKLGLHTRREFVAKLGLSSPLLLCGARLLGAAPAVQAFGGSSPDSPLRETNLLSRDKWASVSPRTSRLVKANGFNRITIHHAGGRANSHVNMNSVMTDIDAICAGHMDRRYGDIGYHFIIDSAGRIWEGRSLAYEGAHVSGRNPHNVGILLLGNFEKQEPSPEALTTMRSAVGLLSERFDVPAESLFGHCDIGASICPGSALYPHVVSLRKERKGKEVQ